MLALTKPACGADDSGSRSPLAYTRPASARRRSGARGGGLARQLAAGARGGSGAGCAARGTRAQEAGIMRSEVAACMALCRQALGDETGKLAARGGGAARYTAEERTRFASARGIDATTQFVLAAFVTLWLTEALLTHATRCAMMFMARAAGGSRGCAGSRGALPAARAPARSPAPPQRRHRPPPRSSAPGASAGAAARAAAPSAALQQ